MPSSLFRHLNAASICVSCTYRSHNNAGSSATRLVRNRGYEAVGEVDSRLETFADWKRPNEDGVIYYLQNGRVRGVLLWNVWEQVEAARQLIAEPGPFTVKDLAGRLPAKTSSPKR